jgi:hypothetical protein
LKKAQMQCFTDHQVKTATPVRRVQSAHQANLASQASAQRTARPTVAFSSSTARGAKALVFLLFSTYIYRFFPSPHDFSAIFHPFTHLNTVREETATIVISYHIHTQHSTDSAIALLTLLFHLSLVFLGPSMVNALLSHTMTPLCCKEHIGALIDIRQCYKSRDSFGSSVKQFSPGISTCLMS